MTGSVAVGGLVDPQSDDRARALKSGLQPGHTVGSETVTVEALLEATRGLLWIATGSDAAVLAAELIVALGGTTVSADIAGSDAIPVDLSFGDGHPILPVAPRGSAARLRLERHLPRFARDAQRAVELAERTSRLAEDASIDALTGLANKRFLGRALGRLTTEDTVIVIDLDHFKAVNDRLGHPAGDLVLRAMGRTIAATLRPGDQAGRYGGEEFVVIIAAVGAEAFIRRLQTAWVAARPYPTTFSAGVAPAATDPTRALEAADRAMYRAKEAGRDQWQWATDRDYR